MRLLLDTHVPIWFFEGDPRLDTAMSAIIEDPGNTKYLSIASVWGIGIKFGLGKLSLNRPFAEFLRVDIDPSELVLLPISVEHCVAASILPHHHRDPFDRMLVAQAAVESPPILSADPTLDAYGVPRLWAWAGPSR